MIYTYFTWMFNFTCIFIFIHIKQLNTYINFKFKKYFFRMISFFLWLMYYFILFFFFNWFKFFVFFNFLLWLCIRVHDLFKSLNHVIFNLKTWIFILRWITDSNHPPFLILFFLIFSERPRKKFYNKKP